MLKLSSEGLKFLGVFIGDDESTGSSTTTAKVARISKEQSTAGGEVGHADDFQWALAMVAGRKTAP
jgi:hypothetical protein